jgi:ferredoxin
MEHKYLKNVVTLQFDEEKCTGCGMCLDVCPRRVFEMENGRARVRVRDLCMECGACSKNCPFSALSVRSGVGCAWAILMAQLKRSDVPSCGK